MAASPDMNGKKTMNEEREGKRERERERERGRESEDDADCEGSGINIEAATNGQIVVKFFYNRSKGFME